MPKTTPSMLALTALIAVRAIYAQADALNAVPQEIPQQTNLAPIQEGLKKTSEKQKDRIFRLLDATKGLARWTPNEASFLNVVGGVQDRLAGAEENDFEPLGEFMPYLSALTESLARMEGRASSMQSPADLCDPARKRELFLLFLDALEVNGQLPIQARVCEKIAAEQEAEGPLSQVCIGANLGFFAAKSMHDRIVVCEPSWSRGPSEVSAAQIERLSAELANVEAGVQKSVHSAKRELTDAMSVVAVHVGEVASGQTKQLEDITVRLEIERALQQGSPYGSIYLPQKNGGRLEMVRTIVDETIGNVLKSGESANGATEKLLAGDAQLKAGHFKEAYRLYSAAYKLAVGLAAK